LWVVSVSSFRRICCYHSTFFYKTFNGNFKEGTEQRITLESRDSHGELPDGHPVDAYKRRDFRSQLRELRKARKSPTFLEFLVLARSNRLLGPFDSVTASTKAILVIDHQHFLAEHVRTAFASSESSNLQALRSVVAWPMPVLHPSWRGLYSQFIQLSVQKEFRFEKDLKESDEFVLDLV
jgi:hypothetical protein